MFGVAIVLVILLAPEGLVPKLRDRPRASYADRRAARPSRRTDRRPRRRRGGLVGEEVLLRVANVSRSFGGLRAVQDVSFDVRKGEVLGVIGPNGAGKTTLFNLLNGFIRPDVGEVVFDGKPLVDLQAERGVPARHRADLPGVRPFPRMTVLDNVVVGAFVAEATDERAVAARTGGARPCGPRPTGGCDRRRADDG